MKTKIQDRARKAIKTVKYGTTIKEIDRLRRIIRELSHHIDQHEKLCEEQERARGQAQIDHATLHRTMYNPKAPCRMCLGAMQ